VAAAPVAGAATKPQPKALPIGNYKVDAKTSYNAAAGGFKTTSEKYVSGLKVMPNPEKANAACGTAYVKAKGKLKITIARRGGYASWIIGKNTPKTSDGVTEIAATFVKDGAEVKGTIKMVWQYDNPKRGSGEIEFPGCQLLFNFKKSK
jgi:hypothetical protein